MPGIFGIICKNDQGEKVKQLDAMQKSMMHESFYNSGTYVNRELGLYSGWICHPGSFSDCMPVFNEKRDKVMIFYGENFPDQELFDQLKREHHKFNRVNAEYIIHMYEQEGESFLDQLNGWFQGIIIDLQRDKIILFNDRYGMQRLYYYENPNAFYFSSEAKALLKVNPEIRVIENRSLGEYLTCNCVLEWRTLFQNVFILPGASVWSFRSSKIEERRKYFDPESWENQPWLEKEYFYDELKKTFRKILPRYFIAEQDIGISLTGGLDTRMILSNIDTPQNKYPCYSFNSIYRDCNDVKVARKVASACGQTHHTIELGQEFLNNFVKYAEKTIYITDGNLDVSGAPEIYVNNLARQIAPIRMTGNHGSELFRNVKWMKATIPDERMFEPGITKHLKEALATYSSIKVNHPLTCTLFMESPWHECNRFLSEQSQLVPRTPYHDKDLAALMYRSPPELRTNKEISKRLIADGSKALANIPTDRGVGGKYPPPISIVPRLYNEFFFKSEYYYNYGMPQWLSKIDYTLKSLHIEKVFLGRHKFYHFRVWYRDQLAKFVKEILLDERTLSRPYLNRTFVEHIVEAHTKGYRNYTTEITKLLTIELIHRNLIEDL